VAVLLAVAGISIWSSVSFYQSRRLMNVAVKDSHGIEYFQRVLGGAAVEIPEDAAVGYVSDASMDDPRGIAQFFAAQYVLAPRLLVEEGTATAAGWIVGVFGSDLDVNRYAQERGWMVVRKLDAGLVLFRRKTR